MASRAAPVAAGHARPLFIAILAPPWGKSTLVRFGSRLAPPNEHYWYEHTFGGGRARCGAGEAGPYRAAGTARPLVTTGNPETARNQRFRRPSAHARTVPLRRGSGPA